MNLTIKHTLHWIGSLIAFSGVIFVVVRLNDYGAQLDFSRYDNSFWLYVFIYVGIYATANIMMAFAWWNLLNYFKSNTSLIWAIRTYSLTQLAKYIPGNIMHLASRQVIGIAAGVKGWVLVKTSVWEIGLISFTGALFFILLLPYFFPDITHISAIIVFAFVIVLLLIGLNYCVDTTVLNAFVYYFIFLIVSGVIFLGLLILINGNYVSLTQSITLCAAFIVAWLAGLVTPGAPAGVGVREAVLMMLLADLIPQSDLLLAVLLSRIVTVAGDICFFMGGSLLSSINKS